jgi:hypothetical protein
VGATDVAQAVGTCVAALGTVGALAFYGLQLVELRKDARDAALRWEEELDFQSMPRLALTKGQGGGVKSVRMSRRLELGLEGQGTIFDISVAVEGADLAALSIHPPVPHDVGAARASERPVLFDITWPTPEDYGPDRMIDVVLLYENARGRRWEWRQQVALSQDDFRTVGAPQRRFLPAAHRAHTPSCALAARRHKAAS